jgi:adenylate kinase family enzyme
MKRIVVIGTTGSGKTTLAKNLAAKLEFVHIDLDDLHWLPDWQERPSDDFRRLLTESIRAEKWVVAGNYSSKSQDITWPQADTLIWIDLPFWPNFRQLLRRTFRRAYTGEMICNGNTETLGKQFFTKDSILLWFLKTWHKNHKKYAAIFANPKDYPHLRLIRLRSHQQARDFIDKPY